MRGGLGLNSMIWDKHKVKPWNFTPVWQKGLTSYKKVTGENLVEVLVLVPYPFEILELLFHAPLVE